MLRHTILLQNFAFSVSNEKCSVFPINHPASPRGSAKQILASRSSAAGRSVPVPLLVEAPAPRARQRSGLHRKWCSNWAGGAFGQGVQLWIALSPIPAGGLTPVFSRL